MGKKNKIVIGTRGSKLALWQAESIRSELQRQYPRLEIEIIKIKTTGDKILDVPLAQVGGKGLFVKEIEEALLQYKADIAVHSMKDVPTELPDGLHLAVICKREDPRDALIVGKLSHMNNPESNPACHISDHVNEGGLERAVNGHSHKSMIFSLPAGARIGTSSLRRMCQLFNIRPDLKIEQLRGNLDTRIRKLDEGQVDAITVATAGVKRLGLQHRISEIIPFEISLPAIGQGAIGVECRVDDEFVNTLITPLNHQETFLCVQAERAFLKRLEGGCQVPIAAFATLNHKKIIIDGLVGTVNGDRIIRSHIEGSIEQAEFLGITLAEDILSKGARWILDEVYKR